MNAEEEILSPLADAHHRVWVYYGDNGNRPEGDPLYAACTRCEGIWKRLNGRWDGPIPDCPDYIAPRGRAA